MVEVATYRHNYWAEPKDPTQFGSVSVSVSFFSQLLLMVSVSKRFRRYSPHVSVSGSEIQNICIGRNLAYDLNQHLTKAKYEFA